MSKIELVVIFTAILLFHTACEEDCNDVYQIQTVRVEGLNLQEVFTIRERTGDTLYHAEDLSQDTAVFTVVEDGLLNELRSEGENFIFTILAQDSLKIEQNFVFRPDDCHVEKLSGPSEISF